MKLETFFYYHGGVGRLLEIPTGKKNADEGPTMQGIVPTKHIFSSIRHEKAWIIRLNKRSS